MDSINIDIKIPDVDKNITSVKELRERIAELKDQLVTLDSGTKEYNDTVRELQANTSKLNEVNSASKQSLDALPGSYNAINAEMKELMQQYKSMAVLTDEDKQKQTALAEKINDLNNKLKEQDAAVGVFNRNVGNYSSAFEGLRQVMDVTKTGTEQLGQGMTSIGSIIATTTGQAEGMTNGFTALGAVFESTAGVAFSLFDSIDKVNIAYQLGSDVLTLFTSKKSAETAAETANTVATKANTTATVAGTAATKTAETAQKGFNKALLANPITLVAVALLALVANLDKLVEAYKSVKNWITGVDKELEKSQIEINNARTAFEKYKESVETYNTVADHQVEIAKAQGKTDNELIDIRLKNIAAMKAELWAQISINREKHKELLLKSLGKDVDSEEVQQRIDMYNIIEEQYDAYKELNEQIEDLKNTKLANTILEERTAHEKAADAAKKHAQDAANAAKAYADSLKATFTQISDNYKTYTDQLYTETTQSLNKLNRLIKNLNDENIQDTNSLYERLSNYSDKYLVHTIENAKKERDLQIENNHKRKDELKEQRDSLKENIATEEESLRTLKKSSNAYKAKAANISLMRDSLKNVNLALTTIDEDIRNNDAAINKLFNDTLSKFDASRIISLYGSLENASQSITETSDVAAASIISEQEKADKLNDTYEEMNELVNQGVITNNDMSNVMMTLANNYINAGNSLNNLNKETRDYITSAQSVINEKTTAEFEEGLKEQEDAHKKHIEKLKEQQNYFADNMNFQKFARMFGWDKQFANELEVEEEKFQLRLLEKRKKFIEDQLQSPLLSDEERQKLNDALNDVENSIAEKKSDIQKLIDELPPELAKQIGGVLKTMSMIQGSFNAVMSAAKQKADRIKKDTSLTAEQQERLIEKQQKQYNAAFEANKRIEYANTVINTAAAAISAYRSMVGIPFIGPALAAAAVAATVTTGAMQLKQIANTRPDDLSSSVSTTTAASPDINTPTINVNDLINADRESENLNSDYLTEIQNKKKSDTRVYVVQTDIDETQNTMKTQVKQSTF